MSTYRLFIAIELPQTAQQALAEVQTQLKAAKAVRWTKVAQIHLTLQFLGDTPSAKVEAICTALESTIPALASFKLTLNRVGAFPTLKRPRVIWAGVSAGAKSAQSLQKAVISATESVGIETDQRPFKPHLTIGRVQKWAKRKDHTQIEQVVRQSTIEEITTFSVNRVCLIRSQLKPSGPIYTTLAEIKLG